MGIGSKKIQLKVPTGVNVQVEFNYTDGEVSGDDWFYAEDVTGKLIPADADPTEADWSGEDGVRKIRISVPKQTDVQVEYSYTDEQGINGSWFAAEDVTSIWARDEPEVAGQYRAAGKICLP